MISIYCRNFYDRMNICITETIERSIFTDVAISLPGVLPESGTCFHVPSRMASAGISFTVKAARVLYTLCCNWEKLKFSCSVSLKKVKETVCRTLRLISPASVMKPVALLTADCVRLRL